MSRFPKYPPPPSDQSPFQSMNLQHPISTTIVFTDSEGTTRSETSEMSKTPGVPREFSIPCPKELDRGWTLKITMKVPLIDLHHVFITPLIEGVGQKQWVHLPWTIRQPISTHCGLPLICGYNRYGTNRFFFGALDQVADAEIAYQIEYPQKDNPHRGYGLFSYQRKWFGPEQASLLRFFVTDEPVPWETATQDYTAWHDRSLQPVLPALPEAATEPVWCSWYVCTERVNEADILRNLAGSVEAGMRTMIIDAGWSETETSVIPDGASDWTVNAKKFPDLKKLVLEIQRRGLKAVLWCAPFFVGQRAKARPGLEPLLGYLGGRQMNSLDPRLAETQHLLGQLVTRLMTDYQLDGVKLDFIDPAVVEFAICPTELDVLPGRNYTTLSVAEGTEACLRAMTDAARAVRPDALVEYRQNYSNLATRPFATAFRSQDSPYDPDHIRHMVCLLRMTCPKAAIHADPAVWDSAESDVNVARFLASMCFYSVPFFSLDFPSLPPSHFRLVKSWLDFYREHCGEIHQGRIKLLSDDPRFSSVANIGPTEAFVGLFAADPPCKIDLSALGVSKIWLFNGTTRSLIELEEEHEIILQNTPLNQSASPETRHARLESLTCAPGSLVRMIRT